MAIVDRERWRELEPLLDQALDLPADQRARWLEDLRRRSPDVAREIDAILSGEDAADARAFLSDSPELSLEGVQIGAYTIERPLGHGGMGSVWLAHRTDGRFEARVAVKLMNLALLGPRGQERFRREGTTLARLTHPGIARLLDAGVAPTRQPYLVIEHVDGQHIDIYAEDHELSRADRIGLVLQVLDALAHAHANLVVHRDIKPSNILVTPDGRVKLLDFGIAKLLDGDTGEPRTALTAEGGRVLTPEYAAPEQVRGETITTATDVYAVGVLLYELLSGTHPTAEGRDTPVAAMRALLEREPARLGLGDLDTVLAKALRKDPRERYQTASALADDLRRYLAHEPVSARPDSLGYRASTFLRRHRAAVAAAAAVAVALVGATAFSVAQMREAQRQRDAVIREKRRADAQLDFDYLLMSRLGDRPLTMRELLDEGRRILEREHVADPQFLSTLLVEMAYRYAELGDTKARAGVLARAESLALAHPAHENLAVVRCQMADNLRIESRYDDARRVLDAADAELRDHPEPRAEAKCLMMRAELEANVSRPEESLRAAQRAIAIQDSLGETRNTTYLGLLNSLAAAYETQNRYRDAVAIYGRIAALLDSIGRGDQFIGVILTHNLAASLYTLGETAEAERLERTVLDRAAKADPSGRLPLIPLDYYGLTLLANGRADSALVYYRLLARRSEEDGDTVQLVRALVGLATAEAETGRAADARRTQAWLARVAAGRPEPLARESAVVAGLVASAHGDTAAAHARFVHALRLYGYFDGRRPVSMRPVLILAAETAIATGKADSAVVFAREAGRIAAFDSLAESRSAFVGEARVVEARALLARGDAAAATEVIGRGLAALRAGAGAAHPRVKQGERLLAAANR